KAHAPAQVGPHLEQAREGEKTHLLVFARVQPVDANDRQVAPLAVEALLRGRDLGCPYRATKGERADAGGISPHTALAAIWRSHRVLAGIDGDVQELVAA